MNAFEVVQPRPVRGGWSLRGYKGKGGGGGARQPVEAADSLHSTSYARVLDLLSEGEIAGLVNGLQSIYLNNTPLANADGSFNFAGVTADFRAGFQTQDPIPGFPSTESPAAVGVELKAATPWVRSILNRNLSAVRVTLGVDGLSKANTENGDISGHTVNYAIDLQTDGGAWVEVLAAAFTGKTTQQYRRTHRIDLPTAVTSWTLRVRRITPNANSNTVADTTVIESITEVIDAKLRYPMSALVGLQVDASQFRGSVPTRAYHCRGRIIRVPSNYDPVMRSYAGIWDGTFKSAYSNNPAWVFYDLATNDRYGLGKRIPAGWINKWSLYQIGVYCDGMVSNGRGGVEPRFTCNAYLQSRGDATRVLQDLCSIFRGMVYWAAGAAVPVADMPRDPAVTYSQADVIDGRFSYSGSRLKDRHTVALVSYNDMTDFGRQKVFPYQDDAAVARYGIRKVEISAFGCTSEAQAQRVGQWAVLTAQRETRSVSFSLGLKGTLCSPGQVIEIADSAFAGRRMGGLVKSATAAKVVLDAPVMARAGDSITVMLSSGVAQSRRIAYLEMIDGAQHVSVNPAFDAAPVTESSWAISTADVATQLFTVLSVTEGTGPGLTFDVSAIQHEPGKFAAIDQGALLPERPVSVVPAQVLPTPIGVTVGAHSVTAGDGTVSTTVTAAWQAVAGAAFYDVEWSRSQSDWVRMPRTALTVLDIPNAYTGDYLVRVRAISAIDTVSAWGYSAATTVAATALPPRNYDTFMVAEMPSGMRQYSFAYTTQRPPADLAGAEIRYILGSPVNIDWQQMRPLDDGGYYTNSFESTKPEAGLWTFALRARSRSGVLSEGMLIWRGQLLNNVADVVPDLTPPPLVTGLMATGMLTSVQVAWDAPLYAVGHGHARTEIWAGQGADLQQATPMGEGYAGPISFSAQPAQSWNIWARNVSVDGVAGNWAGPVAAATGEDVAGLLEVLAGKVGSEQFDPIVVEKIDQLDLIDFDRIDALNDFSLEQLESVAQVDLKRLDLIDIEGGPLGKSLVTAAAQQDALNQQVRGNMEDMAKGLLEAALAADAALERITDAGVYVDPATGQVKIYGLETTKTQVTNLEVLLDALSGQLLLKASTAYVDGRIAEAVLSPADLLLYEGLDARLINVAQQLDSINGTLSSKAEALELQNAVARLTTAESNLDALGAQIALRVTRAEYEAAQDALQTRLGSAELTLSALDVPAITATVTAVSKLQRESDKTAQALLQDILNGEYNRVQAQDALAFARNQLSASIQEGLSAEAAARTQLAATVDQQAAALEQESLTRATADAAEASQRQALAATVQGNHQQTTAAIEAEQAARVDGDAAEAAQREALRAQMQGDTDTLAALLEEEATTRATADSAEASARLQLATQLQQADSALGAEVSDERNARIAADEAEAAARTALATRLDGKDSDLAAQVSEEQSARVAGDAAEALARQQLAAAVEQDQGLLQAQIEAEATARVEGDRAETTSRESQISVSRELSKKEGERTAQALLQDILTGERNMEEARTTLALAKVELSTQIQEGLSAEAVQRTQLAAVVDGQKAALEQESRVRADGDAAEALQRQQLAARLEGADSALQSQIADEQIARVDADTAEAISRQALAAQMQTEQDAIRAQVSAESQARATAVEAEASARQQLAATVGDNHAAVQQQFTAQAGINGYLAAKYSLAVQVGSGDQVVVGGMQITGTADGEAGPKIAIAFATDAFSIVAPDGSRKAVPFYVQTSDMTINGVPVPAGVYMDSARIGNVEALFGRFGSLFADKVQATAISASQLTAGNGVIGGTLKSSNYVAGSSGWTLRPDGMAEFSGVIVRGTIYSTAGSIGGITINANGLNAGAYTGYAWPAGTGTGFHLGPNGLLLGNPSTGRYVELGRDGYVSMPGFNVINGNATFSGRLEAASGTFAGALQAATGSFSGVLTASAINAVNTINIAGGAISANAAAYSAGEVSFSNYDTEVEIAAVNFVSAGGSVMALVGFGLTASGGITSSNSPLIRVRLRRNGIEVRRIDLPCEIQTEATESGYYYISRIVGMPISLPPLTDTPGPGSHTFSVTVEARMMGNSVNVTTRNRGISIMEIKR